MIFVTRKKFQEEMNEKLWEQEKERNLRDRLDGMERRIAELEMQLYDVRMKCDEDFRRRNTPTCYTDREG